MGDKSIKFVPVRGTEIKIQNMPYKDGSLYFATDTNKIYLDTGNQRLPMGGAGISLYYIDQTDIPVNEEDELYLLNSSSLVEESAFPKANDLLINSDGAFYKIISIENEVYSCERIAISGGGGEGSEEKRNLEVVIDSSTLKTADKLVHKQDYFVSVIATSTVDPSVILMFEFTSTDGTYTNSFSRIAESGKPYKLNLNFLPINDNIRMKVSATSDNFNKGENYPYKVVSQLSVIDFHIDKVVGQNYIPLPKNGLPLTLRYIPYGRGLNAQLKTAIDGIEYENGITLIDDNFGQSQTLVVPDQSHGVHIVELWLNAIINGESINSSKVTFECAWIEPSNDNTLIWLGSIDPVIVKYENAIIPYMVYDPVNERSGAKTTVNFFKNGVLISSEEVLYSGEDWHYWDATSYYEDGPNEFTISAGSNSKLVEFTITTEGSRDLSLKHEQTSLLVNFDSLGRSSSEITSSRGVWKSKKGNYSAILNNFNWYNNGWKDDKDGFGSYLSVANGASVNIPFITIGIGGADQWTFELRFRVRNSQKYGTLVTEIPLYKYWIEVTARNERGIAIAGVLNDTGKEQTLDWIEEHGYEVKLDSDGNKEMEESNTTKKIVETNKNVVFKYLNGNNEGFCIGTQEAYFTTSGKTVNVRYKENEIINISFVVDVANPSSKTLSIYLNGILSGAVDLTNINPVVMENIPFTINSDYCDFDLYKFRVYNLALTMPEVIHNYLADIKNIELYDENQLANVNDPTKLSYEKLLEYNREHPDDPTMPYALIDSSGTPADDELPHFKGGNKKVSITFVNPTADRLLETGKINDFNYYSHCPSFIANNVDINVQGTSSQKYPRRNFKVKFGKAKNWQYTKGELTGQLVNGVPYEKDGKTKYKDFILSNGVTLPKKWHADNEFLGTDKFTWKIDYMESSGSYNTGFANLLGNNIYSKHPLDDLGIEAAEKGYRTSVYGFPFLVFHKKADGSITYIGRYNFNLDKGSNEYYGFEEDVEQPYITEQKTVEVVNENTGETEIQTVTYHPTIAEVAECWELRDNQGTWCSWRYPTDAARAAQFMAPTTDSTPEAPKIDVAQHFEARYHIEADAIETAQKYKTIDDSDPNDSKDYTSVIGGSTNAVICAYLNNKLSNLKVLFNWLDSTDVTHAQPDVVLDPPVEMEVTARSDDPTVTYSERIINDIPKLFGTFTADTVEYRRQKFRNEFEQHLDLHYCLIYFIMTELLLCYDSRGKNMMIATFGPRTAGGDYIWYPMFYDIDTQLGLNNVGALLWDYDEDNSENKTFSTGDSVLWTNFYDMFRTEILATYSSLRLTKLTYNTIEGAYICDPKVFTNSYAMRGKRPIIAIGLDEYYKYVLPVTEPWKTQDGIYDTANYLYACQGDRILSRELLINNRLLYMDSKWHSGDFTIEKTMSGVTFRVSGNDPVRTSDKYLENVNHAENQDFAEYPVPYYDATPIYTITPYLNFYITWFTDENSFSNTEAYDSEKYPNGMNTIVSPAVLESFRSGVVDEQLNYFPGADYISSLGDLSTKYLTEVYISKGAKLLDITLGSDAPEYYNNKMKVANFELGTGANKQEKGLLQRINLSHLRSLDTFLDITNAKKLREFRALDTPLRYALFADGAPLSIVHLPSTVTRLKFIENKNLTRILTETPVVAEMVNDELVYKPENTYSGLYVQGLTDYDKNDAGTGSNLTELDFEGDALGYGSYKILANAVALKTLPAGSNGTPGRLSIRMDNVNWTPYQLVDYGEIKSENITYYYLTDHGTYIPYNRGDNEWENDTLNERVYTFNAALLEKENKTITDLSLLEQFYLDYKNGKDNSAINQFTNNNPSMITQATVPTLSGQLFVNNDENNKIKESDLDKESGKFGILWPNLTIRANYIEEAYLLRYVQIMDGSGKEEVIKTQRYSKDVFDEDPNFLPTLITTIPYKENYDFKGWAKEAEGIHFVSTYDISTGTSTLNNEEYNTLIFSNENSSYTLYAIFELHKYNITFFDSDYNTSFTKQITYGHTITVPTVSEFVPYKDDSNLQLTKTYKLKGWSTEIDGNIVDLSAYKATRNYNFYPIFEEVSVYDNVLSNDYYTTYAFGSGTWTDSFDSQYTVNNGLTLRLKTSSIKGKITLPTMVNSVPIVNIASEGHPDINKLSVLPNVTHIFFAEHENSIRQFDEYVFYRSYALQYVEFPTTLRVIRPLAFSECPKLGTANNIIPSNTLDLSNTKLAILEGQAFQGDFEANLSILLPGTLRSYQGSNRSPFRNNYSSYNKYFEKITIGSITDKLMFDLPLSPLVSANNIKVVQFVEIFADSSVNYPSNNTINNVADYFSVKDIANIVIHDTD